MYVYDTTQAFFKNLNPYSTWFNVLKMWSYLVKDVFPHWEYLSPVVELRFPHLEYVLPVELWLPHWEYFLPVVELCQKQMAG